MHAAHHCLPALLLAVALAACGGVDDSPRNAASLQVEGTPQQQYGTGGKVSFVLYRLRDTGTKEVLLAKDSAADGLLVNKDDADKLVDSLCPFGTREELGPANKKAATTVILDYIARKPKMPVPGEKPAKPKTKPGDKPGTEPGKEPGEEPAEEPCDVEGLCLRVARSGKDPVPLWGACRFAVILKNDSQGTVWVNTISSLPSELLAGERRSRVVNPGFAFVVRSRGDSPKLEAAVRSLYPARAVEWRNAWVPLEAGKQLTMQGFLDGQGLSAYPLGRWKAPGAYELEFAVQVRAAQSAEDTQVEVVSPPVKVKVAGPAAGAAKVDRAFLAATAKKLAWVRTRAFNRLYISDQSRDAGKLVDVESRLGTLLEPAYEPLRPLVTHFLACCRYLRRETVKADALFSRSLRDGLDPHEHACFAYASQCRGTKAAYEVREKCLDRLTKLFDASPFSHRRDELQSNRLNEADHSEMSSKVERTPIPSTADDYGLLAVGRIYEESGALDKAAWAYANALGGFLAVDNFAHAAEPRRRLARLALLRGERNRAAQRLFLALVDTAGEESSSLHGLFDDMDGASLLDLLEAVLRAPTLGKVMAGTRDKKQGLALLAERFLAANLFSRAIAVLTELKNKHGVHTEEEIRVAYVRWGRALYKNSRYRNRGFFSQGRRLTDRDVDRTFKKAGFSSAKDFFGMLWVGSIDEDGRPAGSKKD